MVPSISMTPTKLLKNSIHFVTNELRKKNKLHSRNWVSKTNWSIILEIYLSKIHKSLAKLYTSIGYTCTNYPNICGISLTPFIAMTPTKFLKNSIHLVTNEMGKKNKLHSRNWVSKINWFNYLPYINLWNSNMLKDIKATTMGKLYDMLISNFCIWQKNVSPIARYT